MASRSREATVRLNPGWSYRFSVLEAEIRVRKSPDEALRLLEPAPPADLSSSEFAVRRAYTQGRALTLKKKFPEAKLRLKEAEKLAAAVSEKPELAVAVEYAWANVGKVEGDTESAIRHYNKTAALAHAAGLAHTEADALLNSGYIRMGREEYDEAIALYNTALDRTRAAGAAASEQMALGNLGWSYYQLGDFDKATTNLKLAEPLSAKLGLVENQQLWCNDLGDIYLSEKNFSLAEAYYSKALSLTKSSALTNKKELLAEVLHNLAQLELQKKNIEKAEDYNRQAIEAAGLKPGDTSEPYSTLTTAEIAQSRKEFTGAARLFDSVIHNSNTDTSLRWQAQSDLAGLYVEAGDAQKADAAFQGAMQTVEAARATVRMEEQRLSFLDAAPFYDDYISFLVSQGSFDQALQVAEFSRARSLAEAFENQGTSNGAGPRLAHFQITDIQRFLQAQNQVILAYWLSEKQSYLWVITPKKFKLFTLASKDEIDRAIESNDRQIREELGLKEAYAGRKLYDLLVKPAASLIPSEARLIIVSNRGLNRLNFETLVADKPKPHYWVEDVEITNAGSLALLVHSNHRRIPPNKEMLLIGNGLQVTSEFKALPHAGDEIKKIAARFPSSRERVLQGKNATPLAYMQSGPSAYRYIHFVAHGTASETSPLDSAIILSPNADDPSQPRTGEHPFKLYARDIARDDKHLRLNAELVTISACDSAGHKAYSGEGLVGLAWAFMRAGAHQVVASLWDVDDADMPQAMDEFYVQLKQGKKPAAALRSVKLRMLHEKDSQRLPHYWASLQLYSGS